MNMSDWKNVQYKDGKLRTGEGGGGGSSTFAGLDDVDFSNLQDGQVAKYDAQNEKWINANESGGSSHTYSTTEQVIGTWIDGKPLYEKIITGITYVAKASWENTGITIQNLDKVISCKFAQASGNLLYSFVDYFICRNGGNGAIEAWSTSSNQYTYGMAMVQYTKTTD